MGSSNRGGYYDCFGQKKVLLGDYKRKKFLRLFIIPIILHAIWDMPLGTIIVYPVLIVVVWIVLIVLIQNGLKDVEMRCRI